MKIKLAPAILAAIILTGCASPAASPTAPSPSTPSASSQSPTASAAKAAAAEPTTLPEALKIANEDHTDTISAIGAMEDLYRQAEKALKPGMTGTAWGKIEIIRINTSLGALKDTMTDREVILGVKQYTTAMETEAIRQGKA